jgi:hypothetical protein
VFDMVAERQWPATQQAALDSLPRAIRFGGIGDDDLDSMLRAVGEMDSEPNTTERGGFTALAVAIGTKRLASAMQSEDGRRLGAARLLLQEGSRDSLRALAQYAQDAEPEVARLGRAAADSLGPEEEESAGPEQEPEQAMETEEQSVESFEAELGPQGEMVSGLARALGDPDEAVRGRAREALHSMDRETLIHWALVAMGSNDPSQAELGAQVVKTYFCDEGFEQVVAGCPVPVVVAGGKKLPELDALTMARRAIDAGAAGVDMGRNIFQSEAPGAMIQAVRKVVHDGISAAEALDIYRSMKEDPVAHGPM